MRQVGVGKACAVGLLAVAISAAISGGAIHILNRNKVTMYIPHPHVLAGACTVVLAVHRTDARVPIMLDPSIFSRDARLDSRMFYNVKPDLDHFELH